MIPAPPSPSPHAREGLSLADTPRITRAASFVRHPTPREPPRHVKHIQMSFPEPQTLLQHHKSTLPDPQTRVKHDTIESPPPPPHEIQLKSTSGQRDHHMKFTPSSHQFMSMPCQIKIIAYARTISQISPAPHSYHPRWVGGSGGSP